MKQGYLARESERVNQAARKTLVKLVIVFVCALSAVYFLGRDSIDFSDVSYGTIPFYIVILLGIVLFAIVVKIIATGRTAVNGNNLFLPFKEDTQEAVARIIDKEAAEGKILVEEFIGQFKDPKKASGEKIVLLPSYLLICGVKGGPKGTSKVTAIPRNQIYWICAQAGYKGGPFIVKLLIFTDNKIFAVEGTEVEHVQGIAEKIYKYIPNIFNDYDPFVVSYEFEKIFHKNPEDFFAIYEEERKKKTLVH